MEFIAFAFFGIILMFIIGSVQPLNLDEGKLWDKLLYKYGHHVRPTDHWNNKTEVLIDYQPIKILGLQQRQQQITMAACVTLKWEDKRLSWNSSEYGGQWFTHIPVDRIWRPVIAHFKSVDGNYQIGQFHHFTAFLNEKGKIKWTSGETFVSPCKFDVTYFPFDTQTCHQYLQPWPLPSMIDLSALEFKYYRKNRMKKYEADTEWELISVELETRVVPKFGPWNDDDSEVVVTLKLKRKPRFYMNGVLIPSSILSVLVLLVFCIPAESGEKLSFGITLLLTFSVFQMMIESHLPKTSESTPILTTVVLIMQGLSAFSVITSVFILNLHHLGPVLGSPMPKFLRFIFFNILARVTCYSTVLNEHSKINSVACVNNMKQSGPDKTKIIELEFEARDDKVDIAAFTKLDEADIVSQQFRKVFDYIDRSSKKRDEGEKSENVELEWRLAALVVDRVLLILAAVVTLTIQSTLYSMMLFH